MGAFTSDSQYGLGKTIDFTRLAAFLILLLDFYHSCQPTFRDWGLTFPLVDKIMGNIARTHLFDTPFNPKIVALVLLLISLMGTSGSKAENVSLRLTIVCVATGSAFYFCSNLILYLPLPAKTSSFIYMAVSLSAFLIILRHTTRLTRIISIRLSDDVFNELNESFPQEERRIDNEFSINLQGRYRLKNRCRKSWINIINPFRGLLVVGNPGAGKSWFVIQHVIKQHIEKGFAMFIYDFKYDDLTKIAYNWLLQHNAGFKVPPKFFVINFDNLSVSHRCNPLDPLSMQDITDATESSRTILLGLNREWINRQGNFFVESPINFVTAVIWFLRKYEDGRYCTLPHVIELMQCPYDQLFPVLNSVSEIEVLVNPFITAYEHKAMDQLEGQIASAKIGMARLASPQLYWVLSGNDFTLDINNPASPKILCVANNPEKQQVYGAVLSLYISRLIRQVNKKGQQKCSLIFDEFPTIFFNHIDSLIATARSNKVATTIAMQDFSQLKKDYGRDQADVIINITGNILSGQVTGETARMLAERFGKIVQGRQSITVNRNDTSSSHSTHLDFAIPASKISALSSGEFVGMVADDPNEKIRLKMFHAALLNDTHQLATEQDSFEEIPTVSTVTGKELLDNYRRIKEDIKQLVAHELTRLQK